MTTTNQVIEDVKEHGPLAIRASSDRLSVMLGLVFQIGEQGSLTVVDYMGNDRTPARAARVSYGADAKSVNEDAKLVEYLIANGHTSPFEMCRIRFNVRMPIFVARQWVRHRQASLNEISFRYVPPERGRDWTSQDDFFVPQLSTLCGPPEKGKSKQGRADGAVRGADVVQKKIIDFQKAAHKLYEELATGTDEHGPLSRELARMVLPVGTMTKWTWASDLHNLFHFLTLRTDPHAQGEIRDFALAISWIVREWVPVCWKAWSNKVRSEYYEKTGTPLLTKELYNQPTVYPGCY